MSTNSINRAAIQAPQKIVFTYEALHAAITNQRAALFQVLGIVRLAAQTIREPGYKEAETDAWEALDGAVQPLALAPLITC